MGDLTFTEWLEARIASAEKNYERSAPDGGRGAAYDDGYLSALLDAQLAFVEQAK